MGFLWQYLSLKGSKVSDTALFSVSYECGDVCGGKKGHVYWVKPVQKPFPVQFCCTLEF